jgi:hypothetical protein
MLLTLVSHPPGRTVIAFANPRIALCAVQFENARNPVAYYELEHEEKTRAVPNYQPGPWPNPSRDEAQELYDIHINIRRSRWSNTPPISTWKPL